MNMRDRNTKSLAYPFNCCLSEENRNSIFLLSALDGIAVICLGAENCRHAPFFFIIYFYSF